MRTKLAVVVSLLMVATLSLSGCTSTTNNTTTSSASTTTHDVALERFVTAYKGFIANPGIGNGTITNWQVMWSNGTTANIHAAAHYAQPNVTVTYNRTVMIFPSTDAATAYLTSYNLTGYVLSNTTIERGNVSETALGHPLAILTVYGKVSSDFRTEFEVEQADNLIIITDATVMTASS